MIHILECKSENVKQDPWFYNLGWKDLRIPPLSRCASCRCAPSKLKHECAHI